MDEDAVAVLMAKSLQWASDRSESPALIEIEHEAFNRFTLVAVPGRKFRVTVEEIKP